MTKYAIKNMDTGEILQAPYISDTATGAEIKIMDIKELFLYFGAPCPELVVIPVSED